MIGTSKRASAHGRFLPFRSSSACRYPVTSKRPEQAQFKSFKLQDADFIDWMIDSDHKHYTECVNRDGDGSLST